MKDEQINYLYYNEIQGECLNVALESLRDDYLVCLKDAKTRCDLIDYAQRLTAVNDLLKQHD
jgi:hypothetical protein